MEEMGVNLIVSNSDCSSLISFMMATGYPSATVPLGVDEDGLPFGMFVMAGKNGEKEIFRFMSAFEKTMPGCPRPVLRSWE